VTDKLLTSYMQSFCTGFSVTLTVTINWLDKLSAFNAHICPVSIQISSLLSKVEMVAVDTTSFGNLFQ